MAGVREMEGRERARVVAATLLALTLAAAPTRAQDPAGEGSRAAAIAAQQAEKARVLAPYQPPFVERLVQKIDEHLSSRHVKWHPFYGHAYPGAGLALGAGYMFHTGDFDSLDVRAAMSVSQSTRAETEFRMPRLFGRRAVFTTRVGWREGLGQAFYGLGTAATSADDRTEFDFRQTHGSARLDVRPLRGSLVFGTALDVARYEQRRNAGSAFDTRYQGRLPGAGLTMDFVQAQGSAAFDWRPAEGYARRGGAYGVSIRRVEDLDGPHSFSQVDYDVVQHLPILREAWVLSLHGRAETTYTRAGESVPFFLLPTLGNGTTLRAFANQRFRDRNSLLLSAEWRILINSFTDVAAFYDAGKVAGRPQDLDLRGLKSSVGIGLRIHTLVSTPIRLEVARGNEGLRVVVGAVAAF